MLTKKKIFFVKLDFIGVNYVEKYKEKSSVEFQSMSTEIKREVSFMLYLSIRKVMKNLVVEHFG